MIDQPGGHDLPAVVLNGSLVAVTTQLPAQGLILDQALQGLFRLQIILKADEEAAKKAE